MYDPYIYVCQIVRVVDGDTIDVNVDLGWSVSVRKQRIRLYGVDAPESRTRDLEEKRYGLAAKAFVKAFAPVGTEIVLRTYEKGKYGRWLADIKVGNKWLCKELIKHHHAVAYYGQNKSEIQKAHLANRLKVCST